MGELGKANGRTKVCKETEVLTQRQQCRTLGLLGRRKGLPLWTSNRSEEDSVGFFARSQGRSRQGLAGRIDRCATDKLPVKVKLERIFSSCRLENF